MQTNISPEFQGQPEIAHAESILRKCVHCGFCLATCPTYNILGDELDSPRGRIYQIKQVLEGDQPTRKTQLHLDRCLTCRNCETTCPSGVEYAQLLDVGRAVVEERVDRPIAAKLMRWGVKQVLPYPGRVGPLLWLGQKMKPVLPQGLAASVPVVRDAGEWPVATHSRRMLVLDGCVQPSMSPAVNSAAARVLDRLGVSLVSASTGCCGAINHHLNDAQGGLDFMRKNIDTWWPLIEQGCEAIVITASGCGAVIKEYGHLLAADPQYAEKAAKVSAITGDVVEVMSSLLEESADNFELSLDSAKPVGKLEGGSSLNNSIYESPSTGDAGLRIAFHAPCTLQHGQKLLGQTEHLLKRLGFELVEVQDPQECCGSAGTYSIFQPKLSNTLKAKKLANLKRQQPDVIATANIGCMLHLQSATDTPVMHWIELVDKALPVRI